LTGTYHFRLPNLLKRAKVLSFIHILYLAPHGGLGTRKDKHMPHAAAWFRREDYQSVRQIMDDSDK